jgi:hypothetical protein
VRQGNRLDLVALNVELKCFSVDKNGDIYNILLPDGRMERVVPTVDIQAKS